MATSLDVEGPHVLRTENGLDWRFDTTFPGAEARRGGVAVLGGDDEFALLGSSLVPPAELPIMLFTERGGWEETGALGSGPIAAASRDGLTVLMVMLHSEIQFWVAATPE